MQSARSAQGVTGPQVPVSRKGKFMTTREVASLLRVSEMTIRRAWNAGVVPGISFGTHYRIATAFVLALVAAAEAGQQVRVEEFGRQWQARKAAEAAA